MARGYPAQGMSARKLSIVNSNTFRGACSASAAGALAALAAALTLARGVALALTLLAEAVGVGAGGSGSLLQAATVKPQLAKTQHARRAVFRAPQRAKEKRLFEDCRDTRRGSVRRVRGRRRASHSRE